MRRRRIELAMGAVLLLLGIACSDQLAAPVEEPSLPDGSLQLPQLTVSDAHAGMTSGGGSVAASLGLAYVALPPGSLPTVETVRIRNLSGTAPGVTVQAVDGGFDPVPISATTGDQLELTLLHSTGAVSVAYFRVPPRRPPVVVRTFPTRGRTDLAFSIAPVVIFSEPIDPSTLAAGVRLVRGDEEVTVAVERGADPWQARVVPSAPLEPGTDYELHITRGVRDLDGDSLETAVNIPFRTAAAPEPPHTWGNSRIVFVTSVDGPIMVGEADGTIAPLRLGGVCEVGSPYWPHLSPDGKKVMFYTDWMLADICVTAVDGSSEHMLGIWGPAAWSADGNRILFVDQTGLNVINADGSGAQRIVASDALPPWGVIDLDVAPDGTMAFDNGGAVWLMDADGSRLRRIGEPGESLHEPVWSPDGARIAYVEGNDRRTIGSMAADGSDRRIHFRGGAQLGYPEWSPDGRSIAFSSAGTHVVDIESGIVSLLVGGGAWGLSWRAVSTTVAPRVAAWGNSRIAFGAQSGANPDIFLGEPDGTIVRLNLGGGYRPRLSPDGSRLQFLYDGMAPVAIGVIALDGSELERRFDWGLAAWKGCETFVSVEAQGLYTVNLREGPTSKRLLSISLPYQVEHVDVSRQGTIAFGTRHGEIWLMDEGGASLGRVGDPNLPMYEPDWSPDGGRLTYVAGGDRRTVGSMAADGSDARIHVQTAAGERAHSPAWSPDGSSIAFGLQAPAGGVSGLMVVKLESASVSRLVDVAPFGISWEPVAPTAPCIKR